MRAWAGSYTPQGRSQCAVASSRGRRMRDSSPHGCPPWIGDRSGWPDTTPAYPRHGARAPRGGHGALAAGGGARAVDVAHPARRRRRARPLRGHRRGRATWCSCGWAARPGQLSVKRAVRPDGDGWWVLGDNPFGSTDSRTLGPAQVRGRRPRRASGPAPAGSAGNALRALRATSPPSEATARYRHPVPDRPPRSAAHPRPSTERWPSGTVPARTHGPGARRSRADRTRSEEPLDDASLNDLQPDPRGDLRRARGRQARHRARRRRCANARDLAIAYTPGVAQVSRAIAADPALARRYTWAAPPRRRGQRRHRRARPRRHRPARRAARDGGQVRAVQGLRRARLDPDGARHHRRRRDRRDARAAAAQLRRGQPGGRRRAALLRAGAAARSRRWTAPSCTTTSTAPRSSCSPPCAGPARCTGRDRSTACASWSPAPARRASPCARILLGRRASRDVVVLDSRGVLDRGRAGVTGEKAALAAVQQPARRHRRDRRGAGRRRRVRRALRAARCPRSCSR